MESSSNFRTLSLTANRALAASLLENNLVTGEDIEQANDRLLLAIEGGNFRQVSILNILIFDLKVLEESSYLKFVTEKLEVPLINLHNYAIRKFENELHDPDRCVATWTLPFDLVGDYILIASAYCSSIAVKRHWEGLVSDKILWYATSQSSISEALDRFSRGETSDNE